MHYHVRKLIGVSIASVGNERVFKNTSNAWFSVCETEKNKVFKTEENNNPVFSGLQVHNIAI